MNSNVSRNHPVDVVEELQICGIKAEDFSEGHVVIQIARTRLRIKNLNKHLIKHRKDVAAKVELQKIVSTQRKLFKYLKRTSAEIFSQLRSKKEKDTSKV